MLGQVLADSCPNPCVCVWGGWWGLSLQLWASFLALELVLGLGLGLDAEI